MQQDAASSQTGNEAGTHRINANDYQILQKHLAKTFGVPVKFTCDKTGKGRITFPFNTEEQLENIISIFDSLRNA